MTPTPQPRLPSVFHVQGIAPPPGNTAPPPTDTAPPVINSAPQLTTVAVAEDPRGEKRPRQDEVTDAEEPVVKRARTAQAESPISPDQALLNAIEAGNTSVCCSLIDKFPELVNSALPGPKGLTPLCLAAHRGNATMLSVLINAGAEIDRPASNGSTPLMFAAECGDPAVLEIIRRAGAKIHAVNRTVGRNALCFAIAAKQIRACLWLVHAGADIRQSLCLPQREGDNKVLMFTPLDMAIDYDFSELIEYLLHINKLDIDESVTSSNTTLLNHATAVGSLGVVRMLLKRGANLNLHWQVNRTDRIAPPYLLSNVWEVAAYFRRFYVIEHLLESGRYLSLANRVFISFSREIIFNLAKDVFIHLQPQKNPVTALDGLINDDIRKYPEKILLAVARQPFGSFENGELAGLTSQISSQRILWSLFSPVLNDDFIACASIIGRNTDTLGPIDRLPSPTSAQRLQILIERLSDSICSPDARQLFSGLNLSAESEHKMNQIAEAQIGLLLKGIAHLRERFAGDVTSLPGLCVTRYILITQQLNQEDLYTKMTMSWGLYDPVARAVLRLIQEALGNLRLLDANSPSKEFSEKSLAEKLRIAMVDILEVWDKVPEIVAAIVESSNNEKAHGVPDLLFQQWRLLCEAFGVTKPRYSHFGPRPLSTSESEPVIQGEPVMEVDESPAASVSRRDAQPVHGKH